MRKGRIEPLSACLNVLPGCRPDARSRRNRIRIVLDEVGDKLDAERFHRSGCGRACQRIHRVLHRVRWQNPAVVALFEAAFEIAREPYFHVPLDDFVLQLASPYLHQPNAGFAVTVFAESNRHAVSFPGRWNSRWPSGAAEYGNAPRHRILKM